jgi:hypothetical protein
VLLALVTATLSPPPSTVPAGADLQQALNAAHPGDTISLAPGATYVGSFVLRARSGTDTRPIVLRTAGADPIAGGQRITPESAVALAKLRSPDNQPALRTEPGARFWRVELVEFQANRDGEGDIIALGDGSIDQKTLAAVPSDLTLDRVYVHGDSGLGQKRGVALNSARTTISNSYFADIKAAGQDSQAIAGWNGPGDYLIDNNYIEAAGENLLFGGADPAIIGLTPAKIVIRGNTVSKPLTWHSDGSPWTVKNLFELKNARDVTVERNLFERNWEQGQSGYALLLTVRNQDGGCPWCQVENVQIQHNIVRDVAAGLSILGTDDNYPSRQTTGVVISDNVFDGIDSRLWGGDGYLLQLLNSPRQISIDHNTVIQGESSGVAKIEGQVDDFVFTNNLASHGAYGIIGTDHGIGNDTIRAFLAGASIRSNVLAGGDRSVYPPGNLFPSVGQFRQQFVDFAGHDFRLVTGSAWAHAATDGRSLGADLSSMSRTPRQDPPFRFPRIPD